MERFGKAAAVLVLISTPFWLAGCSEQPASAPRQESVNKNDNPSLQSLISFGSAKDCVPSAEFEEVLAALAPTDEIGRPMEPYRPALPAFAAHHFGSPSLSTEGYSHQVDVVVTGDWNGLDLVGLSLWWTEESDNQGFGLRFGQSPAIVISQLNKLGFDLPPNGQRVIDGEVETYVIVAPFEAGAELTCST